MELTFYLSGLVAILSVLRVITHTHPVYALLYLIVSLLSIACVCFSLGAYFSGALEIIVYAGAIMVLFVFVIMMLNMSDQESPQARIFAHLLGPLMLSMMLLSVLLYGIRETDSDRITGQLISSKSIGIAMFGPYVLAVELASMLLLAALVVTLHLGRDEERHGIIAAPYKKNDDR